MHSEKISRRVCQVRNQSDSVNQMWTKQPYLFICLKHWSFLMILWLLQEWNATFFPMEEKVKGKKRKGRSWRLSTDCKDTFNWFSRGRGWFCYYASAKLNMEHHIHLVEILDFFHPEYLLVGNSWIQNPLISLNNNIN